MVLRDITVLDLSTLLPGQYGTQLLCDLGVNVIKIENPAVDARDGRQLTFEAVNRGKKSVTLDLKTERGREIFYSLAEEADVVFEQFRPGVVDRLEIGYDTIRERNPSIVYCSLTGYGQSGPYRDRVGHDLNYAGFSGLVDMTRPEENAPPTLPGYPIGDMAGGLFSAFAIVSTLLMRELGAQNEENYIDVSMTDALVSFSQVIAQQAIHGDEPRPGETALTGRFPWYGVYETSDGRYVTLAALEFKFWKTFCEEIEREDLIDLHEAESEETLAYVRDELQEEFASAERAEWERRLGNETMFGLVNTPEEVLSDPQITARGLLSDPDDLMARIGLPFKWSPPPDVEDAPIPSMGEHTESILRTHGYSQNDIERFRDDGVI